MRTLLQAAPGSQIGPRWSVEEVYPAGPAAAGQARCLVTASLDNWGLTAMLDAGALVAAELAANAARQETRTPEVLVRVSWAARCVLIEAGDRNPAAPPAPRRVAADAEHGRGLLIVRTLSVGRLAWYLDGGWKVVWAALRKPPAAGHQEPVRSQFGAAA